MKYQISTCRDVSAKQLCAAVNAAFSDYVVPLILSEAGFRTFQRQRGFSADHSCVARAGGDIVAFWFSGVARREFGCRAYTLSVGTHPEHRRRGLSRQLLNAVLEAQRSNASFAGLQLEVITTNAPAVRSYETMGFSRQRTLRVMKLTGKPARQSDGIDVQPVALSDIPVETGDYFDTEPTPQNSRVALEALGQDVHLLGVRDGDALTGWGAVYPDGAVAQLAVRRASRRQGVGSALLSALYRVSGQEALSFVNVDEGAVAANAFLEQAGAQELLQQYEMRLSQPQA